MTTGDSSDRQSTRMGCERSLGRNQFPRPMKTYAVHCITCKKTLFRDKRRINEAIKFGWKTYCSKDCHIKAKSKKQSFFCSNPNCRKTFTRIPSTLNRSNNLYCSRGCAVTMNNKLFIKRVAVIKTCLFCGRKFKSRDKYCSVACKNLNQMQTPENIIQLIKDFYEENGQIPLKREFPAVKAARNRFGTWNKAIIAAGFNPNPVMFSKKYLARDGHTCDSLSEKIIDDWLSRKNVLHERSIPYHKNNTTADFKVNDTYIEFFGLEGQLKSYDRLVLEKKRLWKEKGLKVIVVYPSDLFPINKLDKILTFS